MIFDSTRRHYFRYEKAEEAADNESTPGRMIARSSSDATRQPVRKGDVVWLLRRLGTSSPGRYRFAYAFVVDAEPRVIAGFNRMEGSVGLWMPDSLVVSDLDWFAAFFKRMGSGGTSFQQLQSADIERLRTLFEKAAATPIADPDVLASEAQQQGWPEDSVRYGAIKARRGQADFRSRLLDAYGRRCCISGCRVEALLEAAHIRPHAEAPNYNTRNGLLLRADLHTLYDLHLLGVDEVGNIVLSSQVTDLYYKELVTKARRITPPDRSEDRPSEEDRLSRMKLFKR
jgi:HNH endonuclease